MIGTGGSRAGTWASGAVIVTTRRLKEKVLALAAGMLEISAEDLEVIDGQVVPKGVPEKALPLAKLAGRALTAPHTLPPDADSHLEALETFSGEGITGSGWSGGTHACIVEIDPATGQVGFQRYVVVEDCGRVINPDVVEGQIRGGVAQGIGEVLYEHAAYDEQGTPVASTFLDYLVPTACEIPTIEIDHIESDPDGEFGFRGVGEGGAIVAPAAVTNAIEDALAPFGARVRDQYLPPARILEIAGLIAMPGATPSHSPSHSEES
jgi:carbon-monoxide dehydrogenase large subunit